MRYVLPHALLWCVSTLLPAAARAQSHPLVGEWTLRVPTGVRGAAGTPVMVDRGGELAVEAVGDSLIATMTLAAVGEVPRKSMRMASRRVAGKVAFLSESDARLSNGSDERSVRATSTYLLEAVGDSLAGVLSQEIPGIDGVPDRLFSGVRAARRAPTTGLALLAQIRATYEGKWFTTLRFTQKTTTYAANGAASMSTWYESVRSTPSGTQLRIDIGDPGNGEGVLATADSMWIVRGGRQVAARAGGNTILPLIQSAYVQPVERTVAELKATGVDLTRSLVTREWQGKPVWVVGASAPSDTVSPQFWVEQQTLAVVRAIFSPVTGAPVMDMRFDALVPLAGGWLATRCTFFVGGKVQQTEEYLDWHANIALAPELFSTATWTTAPHWAKSSRE